MRAQAGRDLVGEPGRLAELEDVAHARPAREQAGEGLEPRRAPSAGWPAAARGRPRPCRASGASSRCWRATEFLDVLEPADVGHLAMALDREAEGGRRRGVPAGERRRAEAPIEARVDLDRVEAAGRSARASAARGHPGIEAVLPLGIVPAAGADVQAGHERLTRARRGLSGLAQDLGDLLQLAHELLDRGLALRVVLDPQQRGGVHGRHHVRARGWSARTRRARG